MQKGQKECVRSKQQHVTGGEKSFLANEEEKGMAKMQER
jgi:hypothetical protein